MLNSILFLFMIFATINGINHRAKALAGKNEPRPRNLPSDLLILETFFKIKDPIARRMFAIMAIFGLRNHEVPLADLSPLLRGEYYIVVRQKTKTGAREAWALYPEWIELFGLREVQEPFVLPRNPTTKALGVMVGDKLRSVEIPFDPYDLRHAWARRSIGQLDSRFSATSLGHSLGEHFKTYNRWFTLYDNKLAYQRWLNEPNRLRPPEVD